MSTTRRVSTRNATFQQWLALLDNRSKRHRQRRFVVQGVRPIDEAVASGWTVLEWLQADRPDLSDWARRHVQRATAPVHSVSPDLMTELGGKDDVAPELLAVAAMPPDDLDRLERRASPLIVLFDRPTSPGNLGTVVRSVDALGGTGVIVSGHAADPYAPQAVRATTGSLFRVPVVRVPGPPEVQAWVHQQREAGTPLRIVGTDEHGAVDVDRTDLTGPVLLLTGNETAGLSRAWRDMCDELVRIPMAGHASSLNAANATSVVLYESARQRRGP